MPARRADPPIRLSVIVPCHNAAAFLPTTFASAARNSAEDIEWVFVDDGSTDGTASLLERFRPPAGRAVVLTHESARGLSGARNSGVDAASGRFIAFLDADDWMAPGYLSRLATAIERLGVDFVRTDHLQAEGRARTIKRAPEPRRWRALPAQAGIGARLQHSSMVDYPNVWAGVYDARLRDRGLLTVEERIHTAEDRLMLWRLHLRAESFAVVGLLGYFYRRAVPGSLTAVGDERQLHFFDAYDLIHGELRADPALSPHHAKFVRAYTTLMLHHERTRDRLHPEVYQEFRRRARRTISALPTPVLREALAGLAEDRLRALEALR